MSRVAARRAAAAAARGHAAVSSPSPPLLRFPTLRGALDVPAETALQSKEAMTAMVDELRSKLEVVEAGGGAVASKRHKDRGKLLARERIEALVDPATPFLELAPLAGYEASDSGGDDGGIMGGGVVAGIGRVEGLECMIVANDATVKGGTYFPITVKKHLRAQVRKREREATEALRSCCKFVPITIQTLSSSLSACVSSQTGDRWFR